MSVGDLLKQAYQQYQTHSEMSHIDIEVVLGCLLGVPRLQLYVQQETSVSSPIESQFWQLLEERAQGCPLAYLVGYREFYGRKFQVSPAVLVPRPETELLVEVALEYIGALRQTSVNLAEVGVGSGCVGITLAAEASQLRVFGTEIEPDALEQAQNNVSYHGLQERVDFCLGDGFQGLPRENFDLIVSNPPYVGEEIGPAADPNVALWEPPTALYSGIDGLSLIRRLIEEAPYHLELGGYFALELSPFQAEQVEALLQRRGFRRTRLHHDLSGLPRVVSGRWDERV